MTVDVSEIRAQRSVWRFIIPKIVILSSQGIDRLIRDQSDIPRDQAILIALFEGSKGIKRRGQTNRGIDELRTLRDIPS
jgi:hypothetical protein